MCSILRLLPFLGRRKKTREKTTVRVTAVSSRETTAGYKNRE
jgi:hypothetical protein